MPWSPSFQYNVAKEISDLIEMPLPSPKYHPMGTFKIVKTIFNTIAEALRQNKEVNIEGLGVFSLWERPQTRHGTTHFFNQKRGNKTAHPKPMIETFPPKTYVHFKPDPSIIEALNATRDSGE